MRRYKRSLRWISRSMIGTIVIIVCILLMSMLAVKQLRVAPPKQKTPITIATAEWAPYISPNLEENGPLAQIITDTFLQMGYEPVFEFSNWNVAESDVKNGSALAMGPVIDVDYRNDFGVYSDELMSFKYVLFGKQESTLKDLETASSLSGVTVATIDGYKYWDALENSGAHFESYSTSAQAFSALAEGEVDLVAEGLLAGNEILQDAEFPYNAADYGVLNNENPFGSNSRALHMFVKDSPESVNIIKEFNDTLEHYKATPEFRSNIDKIEYPKTNVILDSPNNSAISLIPDNNPKKPIPVPRKTRAIILEWPNSEKQDNTAQVKLLNGPSAGIVGRIPIENVELING